MCHGGRSAADEHVVVGVGAGGHDGESCSNAEGGMERRVRTVLAKTGMVVAAVAAATGDEAGVEELGGLDLAVQGAAEPMPVNEGEDLSLIHI